MAEVAGTIFGVISLSIQLFDKLNEYTNRVKDARTKAEQIARELDALVDLLENLETIISKLDPTTSTTLTKNSVQECARAIEIIRSRLGDVAPVKSSVRFWARSRNVIKRLAYPFKESDIKYWKDVLSSIQQSLQTALLASQTDQQQRYFTTLQAQLDQLSLNTSAGIQMILDQQRNAQTSAGQTVDQSSGAEISTYQRHQGPLQSIFQDCDHSLAQETSFGSHPQIGPQIRRRNDLSDMLLPVSAVDLEDDVATFRNLERKIRPNRLRLKKKSNPFNTCTCRKRRQERQFVQSPFVVSLNKVHFHDPTCPFWIPGTHDMNFSFGMILCYFILGLRLRVFMTLSIASGTFSVSPSLSVRRIVSKNSPAFKLIDRLFKITLNLSPMDSSVELTRLFQTREASPHDRLGDGRTLLHYFCFTFSHEYRHLTTFGLESGRTFVSHMLRYMSYADASDTDDYGRTCLDSLLQSRYSVDDLPVPLATDLLQHDLKISPTTNLSAMQMPWIRLDFNEFPDPFTGFSDVTVTTLLRSEAEFSRLVQRRHPEEVLKQEEASKLYRLATSMGWVRGCWILLDAGFSYMWNSESLQSLPPRVPWDSCLLHRASESRNQDMMQFWLEEREHATTDCVASIGDLESAVVYALNIPEANIAKIILTHLVKQRSSLRETMALSGVECGCAMKSKGLLDTHTTCALRALDEQGFELQASSWPSFENIYSVEMIYDSWNPSIGLVKTLQFLYDAGFTDIAKADVECCRKDLPPPLHMAIKHYHYHGYMSYSLSELFEMVDWFLVRGADLTDCWPRSRTTASHWISTKVALFLEPRADGAIPKDILDRITNLFRHTSTDDCKCSCSTHGCTSITCFYKNPRVWNDDFGVTLTYVSPGCIGVFENFNIQRKTRHIINCMMQCVGSAAGEVANRWIVTEFIRLCVFSWLGIRHTCCDIDKLWYSADYDFSPQSFLRHPPDELQRIQEEDAYLTTILEEMVPLFDARYDTHEGGLQSFVDEILRPEMKIVLDRLKQEDETLYAAGRREIGVVMVDECENEA